MSNAGCPNSVFAPYARPDAVARTPRARKKFPTKTRCRFSHTPDMPHGAAGSDGLHRRDDAVSVDAVMAIKLRQGSGLAEMLHAQGTGAVAQDRTQPTQSGGMAVQHRDDAAMAGQGLQ